ncbi:glycoside hydrolase family 20 protein [Flavimarina sp. Hel_I_48]|uniref:glycoside hydrolase family 20 protein n=1 Tax=Flavimarina sp. Hel_I_48 TaxID=1392488 RepID=UPI000A60D07C|nr:glycoside hydrolase family 20 protein [Flavimarina sp. Hel_I_48]
MLKPIYSLVLFLFLSNFSFAQNASEVNIIPKPKQVTLTSGNFQFNPETVFVAQSEEEKQAAQVLIERFKEAVGWELQMTTETKAGNSVQFEKSGGLENEAYELKINENGAIITASGASGFLYGIESLRQLLPSEIENIQQTTSEVAWKVPALTIKDAPRFQWRGLMLDVSRHFFKKEYILETIDRLAFLKMNTLHLHLVDDQGWRIEIKKYPKLTEIGAFRVDQEDKAWNSRSENDPEEKGTYGGFYTQEDIKEIVAYAQKKGVTVVPEVEMPAHVMSAIASYPWLACDDTPIAVPSGGIWPITDIFCPGKETTFEFLEDVLTEVMALFPSEYIHVGDDEATKTAWESCASCQELMVKEDLENVEELQSYFMKRIERFVNAKGRKIIGWDEILQGGLPPSATVMSWQGVEGGWEASKQGHDVIMTPTFPLYFDRYQGNPDYEPLAFDGEITLKDVYDFDPVLDSMSVAQAQHVLGAQANLWSEYIPTEAISEFKIYPRLAAVAEMDWTPKTATDWSDFSKRAQHLMKRFELMGIQYSKSSYAVTAAADMDLENRKIKIKLENEFPRAEIRYTLNAPLDASAKRYKTPIELKKTTQLQAAVFKDGKQMGDTLTQDFKFHKAAGKQIDYLTKPHKNYPGNNSSLINVLRGSKNFHDGQWQAWINDAMEVVIDLGQTEEVKSISLGTLENQGSGIYFPVEIMVLVSQDGENFKKASTFSRAYKANSSSELKDFRVDFKAKKARFIKVIAKNATDIPNRGNGFLFVDEILVE